MLSALCFRLARPCRPLLQISVGIATSASTISELRTGLRSTASCSHGSTSVGSSSSSRRGAKIRRRSAVESIVAPTSSAAARLYASAEVREALELALSGGLSSLEGRIAAIRSLGELAGPPSSLASAEDALHTILQDASGDDAVEVREAAEKDELVRRGTNYLLSTKQLEEAVHCFTEVIERTPNFAEGWNKRATANFFLNNLDEAVADSLKTLELKPRHFACLAGMGMCHQAKGNIEEALRWFKASLQVNPGREETRTFSDLLELQMVVNQHLRPQIVRVARALDDGSQPSEAPHVVEGLECDWDVHRVTVHEEESWTYFFRVRVRVRADLLARFRIRSLGRFYALRFAGGRIFPLTRVTDGDKAFELSPSEDYRFCWHMAFRQELLEAAGGLLVERKDLDAASASRYQHADLQRLRPAKTSPDEVERMKLGYIYTGQLNMQHIELGPLTVSLDGLE